MMLSTGNNRFPGVSCEGKPPDAVNFGLSYQKKEKLESVRILPLFPIG